MDALSPSVRWYSFRPKPGMHGCWTPHVNLLPDSPAMGIQNPSTSRKPTLTTPSAGKVTTALRAGHSSTSTESLAGSSRSLAILPPKLRDWLNREPVRYLPGKTQILGSPSEQSPKSFCRLTAAARNERSAVERKIPLPSQRGAKPDQERNEINGRGPPPAGRMPFMSDSTLSRRSAALQRLNPPN